MNLTELVQRLIKASMIQIRVSMPASVESYDDDRQMVQVSIVMPERDLDGSLIPQAVINEVPVSFMRCGGAHLTFPIRRGDTGLLVFADRDVGAWVSDGAAVSDSDRMHAINDAVFVPGIQAGGVSANPDDVELQYQGSTIHIRKDGEVTVTAPNVVVNSTTENNGNVTINGDAEVNGNATVNGDAEVNGSATVNGNATVSGVLAAGSFAGLGGGAMVSTVDFSTTGNVVSGGVSLKSHTHGGVQSGSANTSPPN